LHDPVVRGEQFAPPNAKVAADPLDAAQMADALAILTPWSVYRGVLPSDIAKVMRGRIVIDPYRVLDPAECARVGLDYYTLGMPPVISAASGAARC
jgi:UDPglucose 6-dehydrogenase